MAKKAMITRNERKVYAVQKKNRCKNCNRPRGYIGAFALCRLCLRKFAHEGKLPGVKKASW